MTRDTLVTAGQSFRLLFVTSTTTRLPERNERGALHTLVQNAANTNNHLKSFKAEFRAIGDDNGSSARSNTGTTGDGTGIAIYWLGGDKIAGSYADFWRTSTPDPGGWSSNAPRDENGAALTAGTDRNPLLVWTGTNYQGAHSAVESSAGLT